MLRPSLVARDAGYWLRRMTAADADAVAALELAIFHEGWTAEVYRREMENRLSRYWLLGRGSVLLGFAGVWCVIDEAHLLTIGVRPEYRGQGLGDLLFQAALRHARYRRQERMVLEVRESNRAAQQLYAAYGFVPGGRRRAYYTDNGEDALLMERTGLQGRAFGRVLARRLVRLRSRLLPGGDVRPG